MLAIVRHAERELGLEVRGIGGEQCFQRRDAGVEIAGGEGEHRVVVLLLRGGHIVFDRRGYATKFPARASDDARPTRGPRRRAARTIA